MAPGTRNKRKEPSVIRPGSAKRDESEEDFIERLKPILKKYND